MSDQLALISNGEGGVMKVKDPGSFFGNMELGEATLFLDENKRYLAILQLLQALLDAELFTEYGTGFTTKEMVDGVGCSVKLLETRIAELEEN